MQVKVNGISVHVDELKQIQLSEIKTQTISRAHFLHRLPGNNFMSLLRAGDFVEPSFISHYLEKGMSQLHQYEIINPEDLQTYQQAWQLFKTAKTERDKILQKDKLIKKVAHDFWLNDKKSFLNFVVATFEEFYVLPPHILDHLQKESMLLYTRALLVSTLSSLTALMNGYIDYYFIKDFFNVSFMMDYGLVDFGNFNFAMSMACEAERSVPGAGVEILKKYNRSEGEIQVFLQHPQIGFERAKEQSELFQYPELSKLILFHHEKTDGSGFPKGYSYSALSDAETLLIFCDYLVPFKEHVFKPGDGKLIVKDYFENIQKIENRYLLPINKLINQWRATMEWALNEKKESA